MVGSSELTQERKTAKLGGVSSVSGGDDEDTGLKQAVGLQRMRWLRDLIKMHSFHEGGGEIF